MKKNKVAVIGVGYWGPNIIRNFLKIPSIKVKYACDLDPVKLAKILEDYPMVTPTKNYNEILSDENIDIIAIATPLATHYPLAKKALENGKHVFLEKPMAQTSSQARNLIRLAKKNKKTLMIGHTFLYSSAIKTIKKYIENKRLGKIYYYDSTRINLGGVQSDTNVLWDLAVHDLSILSYIFKSKPKSVYVAASKHTGDLYYDIAHIFLKYPNNITAHIHTSWISPVKVRSIFIGGNKGMITYNDIEPTEKIKLYKNDSQPVKDISPFSPAFRKGEIIIPKLSQQETMHTQLSYLVSCIKKNKKPISDGIQGLEVIKLLEACEQSAKKNKEIILNG